MAAVSAAPRRSLEHPSGWEWPANDVSSAASWPSRCAVVASPTPFASNFGHAHDVYIRVGVHLMTFTSDLFLV